MKGMNYPTLTRLSDADFKRLLGVSRATFAEMLAVLQQPRSTRGRPYRLSAEAQLLLSLSYWRDYPSLFKLGLTYGISETSAWRVVRRVENQLIGSGLFSLPKSPSGSGGEKPVVTVVDVTEIPIERPQKNKSVGTVVRKCATLSKCKSLLR